MSNTVFEFIQPSKPRIESFWRGIILFGYNSATYKFALARSLIEIAQQGKTFVTLEELAEPYSRYLVQHLRSGRKQVTAPSSRFLKGLDGFAKGDLTKEEMLELTVRHGFTNVIDAFHVLRGIDVPRFYVDERKSANGIQLTDELLQLVTPKHTNNLIHETEARWKLVETAWDIGISPSLLVVQYDATGQELFVIDRSLKRTDITSARDALNGYQKGKCFYCFRDIETTDETVHIDHVFPHMLKRAFATQGSKVNLDGVWNLVLACQSCNLAKSDQRPHKKYIERLSKRNEFFIGSHHPLRETLINQTGGTPRERQDFLLGIFLELESMGKMQSWLAPEEHSDTF